MHKMLYNRFAERIKKYQNRGFGVNWIDTNKIILWVINRFHYGEWLMNELPGAEKTNIVVVDDVNVIKEAPHCQCCHCKYIRKE